ncbi:hypothetical protein BVRB_037670, partial [Beta vulgaris subsp. vulgaris]
MACRKPSLQNIDYTKYSHWDRSQALVRFEPVSSNRCCERATTPKRCHDGKYSIPDCRHQTCNCDRRSKRSSKRPHRSSSRHSISTLNNQSHATRQHSRHYVSVEQYRHHGMHRVASARQSSFSVLSQSSAAVFLYQQRRHRINNK